MTARLDHHSNLLALAALLLWLPGCPAADDDDAADDDAADDDATDDDTADDDAADDDSGDDDSGPACGFPPAESARIEVVESYTEGVGWYGRVMGTVHEGPAPPYHVVTLEQGECRYLTFEQGFCDPPCDYDQFCDLDGVCHDRPASISGGTLTITGLGDDLVLEADDWSPGYYYGPWDLPDDLFDAGDPITAALSGGEFDAVTLDAAGVAALDPSFAAAPVPLVDGGDNELTWTAGDDPDACVRLLINGANSSHGMPLNHILWCEGPDDGSFTLPQALVEAFPLGATPTICVGHDCPPSELIRYRRDQATTTHGVIELEVISRVHFGYDHQE